MVSAGLGRRIVAVKPAGLRLLVVVMQPPEWPCSSHPGGHENPALVRGSGSGLRVMSHDVRSVISRDIYSGLYLGRVSLDVPHCDAPVLARFDGVA